MSHPAELEFVEIAKSLFPEMFSGKTVLEIGSLDINGSVRSIFSDCKYIGLDIAPGKGVDLVCEGQKYDAPDESFDVVVSCEVMEHNPFWAATLANMIRLLKPGGLMIMSCASVGRKEHGTTRSSPEGSPLTIGKGWEYYKNLTRWHVRRKVDLSCFVAKAFATNWEHYDLYFLGVKGGIDEKTARTVAKQKIAKFRAIYKSRVLPVWLHRVDRVARDPSRIKKMLARTGWW